MNRDRQSAKVKNLRLAGIIIVLAAAAFFRFFGGADQTETAASTTTAGLEVVTTEATTSPGITVTEDGTYTDKEHVALYIKEYGELPSNFITKKEAEALGWPGGDLYKYADGKSIGGSYFGNYEGLLPEAEGRKYYECDIDYHGGSRGAKRLIYSNDGLFFYTDDHYESFTEIIP